MRKILAIRSTLLVAVVFMVSCASLGVPAPQNTEQSIAYTYTAIATVRDEAATQLRAKRITKGEAQSVLKYTDTAREGVDLARAFQAEGLTAKATAALSTAKAVVSQARKYIGLSEDPKLKE